MAKRKKVKYSKNSIILLVVLIIGGVIGFFISYKFIKLENTIKLNGDSIVYINNPNYVDEGCLFVIEGIDRSKSVDIDIPEITDYGTYVVTYTYLDIVLERVVIYYE